LHGQPIAESNHAPACQRRETMPHRDNRLLASLSQGDIALLLPHLKLVQVKQHQILFDTGDTLHTTYFPLTAIISLVVLLSKGETVEAAMVGRDGVISATAALDGKIAVNRGVVQLAGEVMACDSHALKLAAKRSDPLMSLLLRHEQALFSQAQQSAACMANHVVEARLCRWLLRARDLAGTDTLAFTQEYLGEMLGVRRTSVTVVAHTLQQAGFIKYARGKIMLSNLEGLQEGACECYETVQSHYEELLGHNRRPSS
jgi:CRP-like cAMP-binding protein